MVDKRWACTLELSEEKLTKYKRRFNFFDENRDGVITVSEMQDMCERMGHNLSPYELVRMFGRKGIEIDGEITFEQFVRAMENRPKTPPPPPPKDPYMLTIEISEEKRCKYRRQFDLFDQDGDAVISMNEIGPLSKIRGLHFDLNKSEIAEIFSKTVEEMDQGITFDDYVKAMEHHKIDIDQSKGDGRYSCSLVLDPGRMDMYRRKFDVLDTDFDGIVTLTELKTLTKLMRDTLTEEEIVELFKARDKDIGKGVNFNEFVHILEGRYMRNLVLEQEEGQDVAMYRWPFRKVTLRKFIDPEDMEFYPYMRERLVGRFTYTHSIDLTQQQLEMYKKKFNAIDLDHDGFINLEELRVIARHMGYNLTDDQLAQIFGKRDIDKEGGVNFDEFVKVLENASQAEEKGSMTEMYPWRRKTFVAKVKEDQVQTSSLDLHLNRHERLRRKFNIIDINQDGMVSIPELAAISRTMGYALSNDEIAEIFYKQDIDPTAGINFDDFVKVIERKWIYCKTADLGSTTPAPSVPKAPANYQAV